MGSFDLHINETIEENSINEGALIILKHIRSEWPQDKIQFKLLTDGITNKLVSCSCTTGNESDVVLIRIYGHKTDLLIDRTAEKKNIIMLNKYGLAAKLYASFENGLAYEYIPGNTLNDKSVFEPHIYKLVARHMARMHKIQVDDMTPNLWTKVRAFYDLVPDQFSDPCKQNRVESLSLKKTEIQKEIAFLEDKLNALDSPVVFAHNDLLLGNVIHTQEENKVSFIDFEYAAANYQAFDIGNHFNEFVGLKDVDYAKYPKRELQLDWLKTYLCELREDTNVTIEDVEKLYVQVNQFALISHIFWGVWSLIQAEHSHLDYDFIEYADVRFKEYLAKKEEFLSLTC